MIRHIVMWKFKDGEEENMHRFLDSLRALYGVIPELKYLEVSTACGGNYDAVMISEFDDMPSLERYKNDPRHQAVSALCKSIRTDRASVDYEFTR